jgi:hypothetical protein
MRRTRTGEATLMLSKDFRQIFVRDRFRVSSASLAIRAAHW